MGVVVAMACGAGETPQAEPPAEVAASGGLAAGAGELIEGTPPGGLEDWLGDIEAGLSEAESGPGADPARLQRRLLDLYVGRQEYLEMYWGPSGRLQGAGGEALGDAIVQLEAAFHELLQAVVAEPVDAAGVRSWAAVTKRRAGEVRASALASGLELSPRRVAAGAAGGE